MANFNWAYVNVDGVTAINALSASTYVSASEFYGDGSGLTGITASAIEVADGPEYSIQFRKDTPITGEISGSESFKFDSGVSTLTLTGTLVVSGDISASLGITGSTLETPTTVINSTHISSSLNISGANFYGNGAQLTGISPITNYNTVGDNRILTSVNSSTIAGEENLTFDGTTLSVTGQVSGSLGITGSAFHGDGSNLTGLPVQNVYGASEGMLAIFSGSNAISGSAALVYNSSTFTLESLATISSSANISGSGFYGSFGGFNIVDVASGATLIDGTQISSSLNLSASAFFGDGSNLSGLPTTAITGYTNSGNDRIITSVNSTDVNAEANLTFNGSVLSVNGQISGSLGITGSAGYLNVLDVASGATLIDGTQISSSLNLSASAFYGDGSNLSGLPSAAITGYTNSGNDRIVTSVNSTDVNAEANLTFNGTTLSVTGQISGSLGITGSAGFLDVLEVASGATVIDGTQISSSLNISGSGFFGDGSGLTGLPSAAISTYTNSGNNRIITSVDATSVNSEANLTFDGTTLSVTGQISGSQGITGSAGFLDVLEVASGATVIDGTQISSSLNISGSGFFGDGSGLTGLPSAAITTYSNAGNNRIVTSVNSTDVNAEANLTFDGTTLSATGHISASLGITASAFHGDGSGLTGVGGSTAYNSFTADFTVATSHDIIGVVTTGSAITASLAGASTYTAGQKFIFKDVSGSCSGSTNHIVISASLNHTGDTIDGAGIAKIETAYGSITLTTDGVKSFYIIGTN